MGKKTVCWYGFAPWVCIFAESLLHCIGYGERKFDMCQKIYFNIAHVSAALHNHVWSTQYRNKL